MLLPLLAACSTDETVPGAPQGDIPVGFSTEVPPTRGTEITSPADLSDIGVFAYLTSGDFNASTATPNYMFNQPVNQPTTGTWMYSPLKYWPNSNTDKVSFFAYTPYVKEAAASNPTFQDVTMATGFPTLGYTLPTAEADRVDLLATSLMNQTYATNSGKVGFTMKHALTKVTFIIKNGDTMSKRIIDFYLKTSNTGTLTFSATGFSWTNISSNSVKFTPTTTQFDLSDDPDDQKTAGTFYLLPDKSNTKIYIDYYMGSYPNLISIEATPPASPEWTPGGAVTYYLNLKKTEMTVTPQITGWEQDDASSSVTPY